MKECPKRVIVGLSGGVDSSVSLLLLKNQGYAVEALFMKNWEEDDTDTYCAASNDLADAKAVCESLGIKLHTVNFAKEYWDTVFEHFLTEFKLGRTPNPDILCNREIKFKAFLNYALSLGADYIATGHYVAKEFKNPNYHLSKAKDSEKDQSYFLYTLTQSVLSRVLFPLGSLDKKTVRGIAKEAGFINHNKKDSTGLCFVGERKFKTFLNRYLPAKPGNIETPTGKIIGKHEGLMYYTLGQRQGLGIGGQRDSANNPWYVVDKDLDRNRLIVVQDKDNPLLFKDSLTAKDLHWIGGSPPPSSSGFWNIFLAKERCLSAQREFSDCSQRNIPKTAHTTFTCAAKIRYRQKEQPCEVILENTENSNQCFVKFTTPQRAITPGQAIVFYSDNICLGGGTIL